MNTFLYLIPVICLSIAWLLTLIEWVQNERAGSKYSFRKKSKLTVSNTELAQYLSLSTKIYTLFFLTVIVVIMLLLSPNPQVWH
jgi:L-asparagine transporter-like permease